MNRWIALAMACVLLLCMTACGIPEQDATANYPESAGTTTDATSAHSAEGSTSTQPTEDTVPPETEPTQPTESTEPTTPAPTEPAAPAPTVPTPAPQPPVSGDSYVVSTGNGYRIIREDRSYYNASGKLLIQHYYDYVELTGTQPGVASINAQSKQKALSFLWSEADLRETAECPGSSAADYHYINTECCSVSYMSANFVCISRSSSWYMGGVGNGGFAGAVYDLNTGEIATLRSFANGDPAAFEAQLKAIAWAEITSQGTPWDGSYEKLHAYTLDTFNYSISSGQIILHFAEYEFFDGMHGPVTVCTGIYI